MQLPGRTMVAMVIMCMVAMVKAISDTWSVGGIMGSLDSRGTVSLWRDFSTTAEFPHPSDDYDRLVIQVEGFHLREADNTKIDLLKKDDTDTSSEYIYQSDIWDKSLHGISATSRCLKTQSPILQSSLSVFLVIFNSDGTVFKDTPLQAQVKRGDAVIGVDFPSLVNISSERDLCKSTECKMELSFSVQGEAVTRNLRMDENHVAIFDLTLGLSTKAMLTKKVFVDYHNTPADSPKVLQNIALSLATISPSSMGVTLTLPLTSQPTMYAMVVKPSIHVPTETAPSGDGALEVEEAEEGESEEDAEDEIQEDKNVDAMKRDGDADDVTEDVDDEDDAKMYNDEIEPGKSPVDDDKYIVKTDKSTQEAGEIRIGASTASKDSTSTGTSRTFNHLWTFIVVLFACCTLG